MLCFALNKDKTERVRRENKTRCKKRRRGGATEVVLFFFPRRDLYWSFAYFFSCMFFFYSLLYCFSFNKSFIVSIFSIPFSMLSLVMRG